MNMTQDSDKKPKKPAKKETKNPPAKKNKDTSIDDNNFKAKIQKALQANLEDYAKRKSLSQKQVAVINSFIEEHLSCFILLGYTANGDPVTIVNAHTQKDSDSLGTLIQKFLVKYIDPPPMQMPPF